MDPTVLSLSMLAFTELEAFVELMFLAAYTDGVVSPEERAAFRGQVIRGTEGRLNGELVERILAVIEEGIVATDVDARLGSIRDRLRDTRKRRAALIHAARVMFADGVLAVDEMVFLRRAIHVLGEPAEILDDILREARD